MNEYVYRQNPHNWDVPSPNLPLPGSTFGQERSRVTLSRAFHFFSLMAPFVPTATSRTSCVPLGVMLDPSKIEWFPFKTQPNNGYSTNSKKDRPISLLFNCLRDIPSLPHVRNPSIPLDLVMPESAEAGQVSSFRVEI